MQTAGGPGPGVTVESMFGTIGDVTRNGLAPGGVAMDMRPQVPNSPDQEQAQRALQSSSRGDWLALVLLVVGFMALNRK